MSTAITFRSESSDYYLFLSDGERSLEEISAELQEKWWFSEEEMLVDICTESTQYTEEDIGNMLDKLNN